MGFDKRHRYDTIRTRNVALGLRRDTCRRLFHVIAVTLLPWIRQTLYVFCSTRTSLDGRYTFCSTHCPAATHGEASICCARSKYRPKRRSKYASTTQFPVLNNNGLFFEHQRTTTTIRIRGIWCADRRFPTLLLVYQLTYPAGRRTNAQRF